MIRFMRWLIWGDGHLHKWELDREIDVYTEFNTSRPVACKRVCICNVCGATKVFKI